METTNQMVNQPDAGRDVNTTATVVAAAGHTHQMNSLWIDNNDITDTMFEVWSIDDSEPAGAERCYTERRVNKFKSENIVRFESKNSIRGSDNTWFTKRIVTDLNVSARNGSPAENGVSDHRSEAHTGHETRSGIDFGDNCGDASKSNKKKRYYMYQKEGIDICDMGNSISGICYPTQTDTNDDNQDEVIKSVLTDNDSEDENRKEAILKMLEDVVVGDDASDDNIDNKEKEITYTEQFDDAVIVVDIIDNGFDNETIDTHCEDVKEDTTVEYTIFVPDPRLEHRDAQIEITEFDNSDNNNAALRETDNASVRGHPGCVTAQENDDDASTKSSYDTNISTAQDEIQEAGTDNTCAQSSFDESDDGCDDNELCECVGGSDEKVVDDSVDDNELCECVGGSDEKVVDDSVDDNELCECDDGNDEKVVDDSGDDNELCECDDGNDEKVVNDSADDNLADECVGGSDEKKAVDDSDDDDLFLGVCHYKVK